jgi:endoplasmic reticulum-Golgi intermediate compartment protein 3
VIGNINLSPGRSFQASSRNFYELVPYLRDDGHPHDFDHTIHEFAFEGDDEYDIRKAEMSRQMKQRLGLHKNPLDGTSGRVTVSLCCKSRSSSFDLYPF